MRLVTLTCALALVASVPARPEPARHAVSLNGQWLFATDPGRRGELDHYFAETQEFRWDAVQVPHCWPTDPRFQYTGAAWYRRHFATPTGLDGHIARLRFEAVFYRARVWVNGQIIGTHEGGYTPFEFDITSQLKPAGADNVLAVEVDNSWDMTTLPGSRPGASPEKQVYPWWDYGGLVRDVSLTLSAPVHPLRQKIVATPDLNTGTARVKTTVWVRNTTRDAVERELVVELHRDGATAAPVAKATRKVQAAPLTNTPIDFEFTLAKNDVALWRIDAPTLYESRVTLGEDIIENRFGIRSIEVRGTALLLNGEPIRIGGANRPADDPQYGLIEPVSVIERDGKLMKEAGLEMGRLIHYAPAPALLDWADRHGMLLILEAGNWQLAPEQMDSSVLRAKWQSQMREMMERDWNHPSVIGWSVGNEFLSNAPAGLRWVRDGREFVRSLDTTRVVTFASNHAGDAQNTRATDEASYYSDIVMVNSYTGPEHVGAQLDRIHSLWPDKPMLISEYGTRADNVNVMGVAVDGDALKRQQDYFRGFYAALRTRPWIVGASIWTFNDYRSRFPGTNADGYRWWGLVDAHRTKRPAYAWVREELAPAVLGTLKRAGTNYKIEVSARKDFPSYTLRGYRLRWSWLDASGTVIATHVDALGELAPGTARTLAHTAPALAKSLRTEVLRAEDFSMVDRTYALEGAQ